VGEPQKSSERFGKVKKNLFSAVMQTREGPGRGLVAV
jgi:hypothetical protein